MLLNLHLNIPQEKVKIVVNGLEPIKLLLDSSKGFIWCSMIDLKYLDIENFSFLRVWRNSVNSEKFSKIEFFIISFLIFFSSYLMKY